MTFEDAVRLVDHLLTTEAMATRSNTARLTAPERRAVERVLAVALDKADPLPCPDCPSHTGGMVDAWCQCSTCKGKGVVQ